jgi:hypothetical protein
MRRKNGALTTARIEESALAVHVGCEGRLLANDDPAGRDSRFLRLASERALVKAGYDVVERGGRRSRLADGTRTHSQPHRLT